MRKWQVLVGVVFAVVILLVTSQGLGTRAAEPLVEEVIAIVTAAAEGKDIGPMLKDLARRYVPAPATPSPTPTLPPAVVVDMYQPVTVGDWLMYAYQVHRQPRVWYYDQPIDAENGMFAIVRLKVNNLTWSVSVMDDQLWFEAHDEQGRTFKVLNGSTADKAAHRHVPNHADVYFKMPPMVIDYPLLLTFDVAADSQELWLDIYKRDNTARASIYLEPCQSKEQRLCEGKFIDIPPED